MTVPAGLLVLADHWCQRMTREEFVMWCSAAGWDMTLDAYAAAYDTAIARSQYE